MIAVYGHTILDITITNTFRMDIDQILAREAILKSSCNVLIVGKAGTGKTTFLRDVVKNCKKTLAVVAPSGIAAIEAGGQTIHSFFGFNTAAFAPGAKDGKMNLTQGQVEYINRLEVLIIDEISMVRADLLDHIDSRLRRIRHIEKPFAGVQIVMIGFSPDRAAIRFRKNAVPPAAALPPSRA